MAENPDGKKIFDLLESFQDMETTPLEKENRDRIYDRAVHALKTLLAHAHIAVKKIENSAIDTDGNSLRRHMPEFLDLFFPGFISKLEDRIWIYDDRKEETKEQQEKMIRHVIPMLERRYKDFPEVTAALEELVDLFAHAKAWRKLQRENPISPADVRRMKADFAHMSIMRQIVVVPFGKRGETGENRTRRERVRADALNALHGDDQFLKFPTGPL